MRDELARELLGAVMEWEGTAHAPLLTQIQTLAKYKYDKYQRFEPGGHFIESLAMWLHQFGDPEQAQFALDVVLQRLIFISEREFEHAIRSLYPDVVVPSMRRRVASDLGVPDFEVAKIEASSEFNELSIRTLFLGLSDGARIERLRRAARLNHERVYPHYQIDSERRDTMRKKLAKELDEAGLDCAPTFRMLFLVDDFSGSGMTLIREGEAELEGKLIEVAKGLRENNDLFSEGDVEVHVCLYVASDQAIESIERLLMRIESPSWKSIHVSCVQRIGHSEQIGRRTEDAQFVTLLNDTYDPAILDEHKLVGGQDVTMGFAGCALPLVLEHNTPNNSVHLLWANAGSSRALFPRTDRHK